MQKRVIEKRSDKKSQPPEKFKNIKRFDGRKIDYLPFRGGNLIIKDG